MKLEFFFRGVVRVGVRTLLQGKRLLFVLSQMKECLVWVGMRVRVHADEIET